MKAACTKFIARPLVFACGMYELEILFFCKKSALKRYMCHLVTSIMQWWWDLFTLHRLLEQQSNGI